MSNLDVGVTNKYRNTIGTIRLPLHSKQMGEAGQEKNNKHFHFNRFISNILIDAEIAAYQEAHIERHTNMTRIPEHYHGKTTVDILTSIPNKLLRDLERFAERAQIFTVFCAALESRLDGKDKDISSTIPPMYIGYTKDPETRRRQHDNGDSSSWLQQLVLAAFRAEFAEEGFHFASRAICYMNSGFEVDIAESVLTLVIDSAY